MSETLPKSEQDPKQEAVIALASALHEDWRKTRIQEDGSFEAREKKTKDEAWISDHGTDTVDIANSSFLELPSDWQAENKAAAEVVVGILEEAHEAGTTVDLSNPDHTLYVGGRIHDAWLERNSWAAGSEQGVRFDELTAAEQAKDLDQMVIAQHVFEQQPQQV